MATICTICEGPGKYYLHNNKQKDCETCNTHGLIEPPDETEDLSMKLKEWYTILEKEITRLTRYKSSIEKSLDRLEEMADSFAEVIPTLTE